MTVKQLVKVLLTTETKIDGIVLIDEKRNENALTDFVQLDPYAEKEVVSFSKVQGTPYEVYEIMIARH